MNKNNSLPWLSLPLLLLLGACGSTTTPAMNGTAKDQSSAMAPTSGGDKTALGDQSADKNQADASSDLRRKQLNSDIRAREQRATDTVSDGDIESKVRSKLEANLPRRALTIKAIDGVVTLKGKVSDAAEIDKAIALTKEINGVKEVQSDLVLGAS